MSKKIPAKSIDDAEKHKKRVVEQRLAAFDKFFGIIPPDASGGDSTTCTDFLYDDRGMPGSPD